MILSYPHLTAILKYSIVEIEQMISEKEDLHYHFQRKKGIVKGEKVFRHFHPSRQRLRDLHNRIYDKIFSKIELPDHLHGCTKGRGNITNTRPHQGKLYKFHTDLKSYFDFVTNKMVYSNLRRLGFSQKVARLLTAATTFRGHLAQGPPTSPFLANIAGFDMDNELLELCKAHRITYTRYVDDLGFSSQEDFQALVPRIIEIINKYGFYIGYKKTKYKAGRLVVTGADIGQNGLRPTQKLLDKYLDPTTPEPTRRGLGYYFKGFKQK
ncbi:reverse transcriptase family protein [Chitinophaga rhizosphaerae]|uniref:reverse transcriptase family protein n=1 Tax=Chitinophaga rhizosphaerae TaxID=1864947 RepID=UPI000F804F82|nr:reverse transcriptase family protein [Chitinophaga rhizosphaerae]